MTTTTTPLNITPRGDMEKALVEALVKAGLAAGYYLSVDNGGDSVEIVPTNDYATIMSEMFATRSESLMFYDACARRKSSTPASYAELVYGNEGYTVISDYGVSLEALMPPIEALAHQYAVECGDEE